MMVVSTLNRNWKSFALAIVGAEYVLRWLPRGTHQWDKFVTPDELAHHLSSNKLAITEQAGVVYNPFADRWSLSSDMDVNYMVVAEGVCSLTSPNLASSYPALESMDASERAFDGRQSRNPAMTPVRLTALARPARWPPLPAGSHPPCSPSPRSGFPSPSSLRWARSRAMRCSGS